MIKDVNQIGDQYLLSLGNLTQSVPTNIGAATSQQSGLQNSHSSALLKLQSLTTPVVGISSQSQSSVATTLPTGELKGVLSSSNLQILAQSLSQPTQAPQTLTNSTSINISSSISNQNQSQSQPNSMLYTYFNCKHQQVVTYQKCQFCKECGVRMYKQRERTLNFIIDLADRMRLSKQTAFLSIMFMDYLVANDKVSELCTLKVKDHLQIFGGVCVMLAAKSVELDERIPFLSTLKKYLCLNQYSKEDLRKAEQKTVDILKFQMQIPTLYDLIEYYGSQGIVFSNDMQKSSFVPILQPAPFSNEAKNSSGKKERFVSNRTVELEFQGPLSVQPLNQQQSDSTKNSSLNLNDYSSTQETSSKNSNSDDMNPSCSPPSHSIPEASPVIMKDSEISPFKFYDIVQKIEKDFSRIAFYAIKDDKFYEQDLEILGAACICYLREKQNISNPYRDEILQLCNQDRAMVLSCSLIFLSKFDVYFKPHSYLNAPSSSGFSPLKDIRTNIKQGFYTSENYKSASNLTSNTRLLQENKKPLFDNIDLSSYRVREKSFEKIGISYQSTKNALTSQQLIKNTSSGMQSTRNNYFDYSKPNDQKLSNINSISSMSTTTTTTTAPSTSAISSSGISSSSNQLLQQGSIYSTSSTGSNISNLQSKLLQQQNAFSSGSYHSNTSTSNTLSSGLSSIQNTFSKPYQLALNQYSSKPLLSSTNSTTSTSKITTNIPSFDQEEKWNSHLTKTINSIQFRATNFNSNSFLRRNKF